MPNSITPLGNQLVGLLRGERVQERFGIVFVAADAIHVAEIDHFFGMNSLGNRRGGRIGVDVQLLALGVECAWKE